MSGFTVKEMPSFRGKHESPENDVYAVCEEQDSIELLITLYMQSSFDAICYKKSKNSDFWDIDENSKLKASDSIHVA